MARLTCPWCARVVGIWWGPDTYWLCATCTMGMLNEAAEMEALLRDVPLRPARADSRDSSSS